MNGLYLKTKYGSEYQIAANGDITRLDICDFKPSGDWKMIGIEHVKRRDFIALRYLIDGRFPLDNLLYKNGNPQWTVRDKDHGTIRTWGNTKYHGIAVMSTLLA